MRSARNRPRALRWAAGATALAVLGACSGHHKLAALPTTTLPPPTIPTTTTRPVPPPTAPLTGLLQRNKVQLHAPAVVVKIDNVDPARPQAGINQADVVYEELVEGGLTRLAAVFQSQYPVVVGPVRSGRLTDEGIADDLNYPVFAYSGTNAIFLPILRSQPLTDVDGSNAGGYFYRAGNNVPHNLFSNVANLAKASTTHTWPKPLFSYLPAHTAFGGVGAGPVAHIGINFQNAAIGWDYNARTHEWLRTQNGTADVDTVGEQMGANNVVVLFVSYYTSAYATGEGGPPAPIPAGILTGTGQAWFLSAGKIVEGTWTRPNLTTVAAYKTKSGVPVRLTRGRTWVELVPVGITPQLVP